AAGVLHLEGRSRISRRFEDTSAVECQRGVIACRCGVGYIDALLQGRAVKGTDGQVVGIGSTKRSRGAKGVAALDEGGAGTGRATAGNLVGGVVAEIGGVCCRAEGSDRHG